jgi:hypothetical protein
MNDKVVPGERSPDARSQSAEASPRLGAAVSTANLPYSANHYSMYLRTDAERREAHPIGCDGTPRATGDLAR